MTKWKKIILTGCCITTLAIGAAITADAETTAVQGESAGTEIPAILSPFLVYGNIEKMDDGRLFLTSSADDAIHKEVIITTGEAKILDAVTGMPVSYDSLTDGQIVYAYVGPAMTMSLPPMANAEIILANIPADGNVPVYGIVSDQQVNSDGSASITLSDGQEIQIPADCVVTPYLTRNIVTVHDLIPGTPCLIWSDGGTASQIMVFAGNVLTDNQVTQESDESEDSDNAVIPMGWISQDGQWVYYDKSGELHKGWLEYNGDWYYLDEENGIMQTGFVSVDGKTYYLLSDGKMLTRPMVFTPASDGSLH